MDDANIELATIKYEIGLALEEYDAGEADAIERLRSLSDGKPITPVHAERLEAADEIERLMAALREIVEYGNRYGISDEGDGHALVNIARAAIGQKT